jgi:hypothetical protein
MSTLFSEFAAAYEAIRQLPILEAKAAEALAAQEKAVDDLCTIKDQLVDRDTEIANLALKLAEAEAALAQATFREKEAGDKLEVILGAVKSIVGEGSAAVSLVEPPVVSVPPIPSTSTDTSGTGPACRLLSDYPTAVCEPIKTEEPVPSDPTVASTEAASSPTASSLSADASADVSGGSDPKSAFEALRKAEGMDWYSKDAKHHNADWALRYSSGSRDITPDIPKWTAHDTNEVHKASSNPTASTEDLSVKTVLPTDGAKTQCSEEVTSTPETTQGPNWLRAHDTDI